jgi:hypothetical protein
MASLEKKKWETPNLMVDHGDHPFNCAYSKLTVAISPPLFDTFNVSED